MKNIPSIKAVKTESPKTPGGISKSLLTPCRRVGLSRNWKKAGPSPFVSPLSGNTPSPVEVKVEKKEARKRKERVESEEIEEEDQCTPETASKNDGILEVDESRRSADIGDNLTSTPSRHIEVPRKKKSKTLISALTKSEQEKEPFCERKTENISQNNRNDSKDVSIENNEQKSIDNSVTLVQKSKSIVTKAKKSLSSKEYSDKDSHEPTEILNDLSTNKDEAENVTPVQKSKSISKKGISPKKTKTQQSRSAEDKVIENLNSVNKQEECSKETEQVSKPRSPNELTKECIVVIQKKIFKTNRKDKPDKPKSQTLFDSDSDDVPLGQLKEKVDTSNLSPLEETEKKKGEKVKKQEENVESSSKAQEIINLVDEEDFVETKKPKEKTKVKKLEDKSTSIGGLKKKPKSNKQKLETQKPTQQTQNTDFDDEDDFDFENKKTILIKKSYEKVIKPQKARSTGSITQKDIDELRARIEAKKKMLLARAMTEDTEELRSLIKKWQKGCQDALMELMELMKTKFPDRQNMDYSEMLSMLKIPANLVGYDAENDCFNTPDDANIVMLKFND